MKFLSAVWSLILTVPFTAEDPLVRKWCNVNFYKSVPMTKQTYKHLDLAEEQHIFISEWTTPLNK